MIESIIERMAKNSFQLKSWTMTLVTAVCAFASHGSDKRFIVIAFLPIIGFWIFDSYYLWLERRYRLLYKNITEMKEVDIDIHMDTGGVKGKADETKKLCPIKCFMSTSEICFYPVILGAVIALTVILNYCSGT